MIRSMTAPLSLFFALFLGCMLVTASCGPNKRNQTLHTTLLGVRAARNSFMVWNHQHEIDIAKQASSKADGLAKLEAYEAKSQLVLDGFVIVYDAIAAAGTQTDEASLSAALAAAGKIYAAIQDLQRSP